MFRNYWHAKAGKEGTKLDWGKTWQNWVYKAHPDKHNGTNGTAQTAKVRPLL
jgi:hypothetical protein